MFANRNINIHSHIVDYEDLQINLCNVSKNINIMYELCILGSLLRFL